MLVCLTAKVTDVIAEVFPKFNAFEGEVVKFTANLGQDEEVDPARRRELEMGIPAEQIYIDDDLREEFVRDFVFPMYRANTIYEGEYLLGTSIARPLIAKRLMEIAVEQDADAISHGATGKGQPTISGLDSNSFSTWRNRPG